MIGLLPDVIPHHYSSTDKWNNCSSPSTTSAEDLRMRRGLAPMRFRLDSVGSSVPSATSSAVSTPTSAASFFSSSAATSPMPFDLLPSPTTSSSTVSFFADYPPLSSDMAELQRTSADLDTSLPVDATDAADASAADWRQVGRDLRGIADHFASTRRSQVNSILTFQKKEKIFFIKMKNRLMFNCPSPLYLMGFVKSRFGRFVMAGFCISCLLTGPPPSGAL